MCGGGVWTIWWWTRLRVRKKRRLLDNDNLLMSVGTSDEHLSLIEHLGAVMSRVSCVIVTTPQAVALTDAQKSVSFARAVGLRMLGLIENMSGYVCPCCGEVSRVFSMGGGEDLARR